MALLLHKPFFNVRFPIAQGRGVQLPPGGILAGVGEVPL